MRKSKQVASESYREMGNVVTGCERANMRGRHGNDNRRTREQ